MNKSKVFNIPNLLCMFRIAVIPFMMVLFYFDNNVTVWFNIVLFALAGISDFLDGYIARATGQTTLLGKFLDSSTDKMLVGATILLLAAFGRLDGLWLVPAVIIFLREIFIAGVREFMALHNVIVHISRMGKWKLTVQVVSLGFLVAGPYGDSLIPHSLEIGKTLFLVATVLTIWSGWDYLREAWKEIQRMENA